MPFNENLFEEKDKELLVQIFKDLIDDLYPNSIYCGMSPEEMSVEQLISETNEMLGKRCGKI